MSDTKIGQLKSSPVIKRYSGNPILTSNDVPYKSNLVFNAGVIRFRGKYVMTFRNDTGSPDTCMWENIDIGIADSDDGNTWEVRPEPCIKNGTFDFMVYDPRLTIIEGRVYMCFAAFTAHGQRGGIAVTDDLENFEILSLSVPQNRNLVLFSEKIGGKYVRLERPYWVGSGTSIKHIDIWLSESPDMRVWGNSKHVLCYEDVPFCNCKIGPAAPPLKTEHGWLTIFHSVDYDSSRGKNGWEDVWQLRYSVGVMLLDLKDPSNIIGISKEPLMAPEASYETDFGFRNNVLFPTAMISDDDVEVRIYYGSADTVICLATAKISDLLNLCG